MYLIYTYIYIYPACGLCVQKSAPSFDKGVLFGSSSFFSSFSFVFLISLFFFGGGFFQPKLAYRLNDDSER